MGGWNGIVMRSIENSETNPLSLPVPETTKKRKWISSLNTSDDHMREEEQIASESTMTSSILRFLPKDIIDEILLSLPVKYLLRFKIVSKYWFHYITDPTFVKKHFNFQTINKPPLLFVRPRSYALHPPYQLRLDDDEDGGYGSDLQQQLQHHLQQQQQQQQQKKQQQPQQKIALRFGQIWGPCSGGLLCIELRRTRRYENDDDIICLWNPCTKEFKELPHRPMIFPEGLVCCTLTYGFGYDNTAHDYKVIRKTGFYGYHGQFLHTLVEVYTLGSDSWKVIGNYQYQIPLYDTGVYINGRGIYWIARKLSIDMIICFDIVNEDYKEISSPPSVLIKIVDDPSYCSRPLPPGYVRLAELKGFLCIINPIIEQKCLEVWAMNKEENESNWSKLFTIREPINAFRYQIRSSIELLGNYKNNSDEILMLVDRKELLLYNPKNDKTRALIQMCEDDTVEQVHTCTESLVSLDSGTYTCTYF